MGYEPVLNERGTIPYAAEEKLEESAYREVGLCDMVVSIIGGRFGSTASENLYSISQMELKKALAAGKQLYIFVDRGVYSEFSTYLVNKDVLDITFSHVDDSRVYEFLEEVESLERNNATATFETGRDITEYLREQWAGLFHRFLQERILRRDLAVAEQMQGSLKTLREVVAFLTAEREKGDDALKTIVLSTHPLFEQVRQLVGIRHRVFFTTRDEMDDLLDAYRYEQVDEDEWDDDDYEEWIQEVGDRTFWVLKVFARIFDEDGRLNAYAPDEWEPNWVAREWLDQTQGADNAD
jgi:hypothetical protein